MESPTPSDLSSALGSLTDSPVSPRVEELVESTEETASDAQPSTDDDQQNPTDFVPSLGSKSSFHSRLLHFHHPTQ